MKPSEKLHALAQQALSFGKRWLPKKVLPATGGNEDGYPRDILDLVIFHRLHLALSAEKALKCFRTLKEEYVDWNEVRVSSVREIQESLELYPGSLELAVFIKDLLELLHRERQDVSLEFLAEKNLGEIRQYMKRFRGLDASTTELLLHVRKEHPILPLNQPMELVLTRLGILRKGNSRSKNEKELYGLIEPPRALLLLHHFLLNHALETCPPDETAVECPSCGMRQMCAFYARNGKKQPRKRPDPTPPSAAARAGGSRRARGAGRRKRIRPARAKHGARHGARGGKSRKPLKKVSR